ncbi:MAG: DMT family transporter [Planctomycetota bacterium]|jgi:drug/metabolite transporter (DMT)-like permease
MHRQKKAYLFALSAVLAWSTVASAFKITLKSLSPIELLFFASLGSTVVLFAVLLFQKRWKALKSLSRAQVLQSIPLGILNPLLYYLVLFEAYRRLQAQEAQPLNYTWAIVLVFLSVPLLGQRIRLRDFVAAFICYFGVVVISTHGDLLQLKFSDPIGVGLALGSSVIWALYWIYNTKSQRDPVVGLFLNFLFSLPPVFVVYVLAEGCKVPEVEGLLGAAYVGVFEMGVTFLLWLSALRLTDNTAKVGNLIFLSPFLSLIFIHYFVGETILASSILGLALIVGGLLFQRAGRKPETGKK